MGVGEMGAGEMGVGEMGVGEIRPTHQHANDVFPCISCRLSLLHKFYECIVLEKDSYSGSCILDQPPTKQCFTKFYNVFVVFFELAYNATVVSFANTANLFLQ